MILKGSAFCDGCYRPAGKRLALFAPQGDYQCYAESYVKCFWGLCDLHKSHEDLIRKKGEYVVTEQPTRQTLPYKNPITKELIIYGADVSSN